LLSAGLDHYNTAVGAAALRLMEALDASRLHGALLVLMPDGQPLPRALPFPGAPHGNANQRLAHALAVDVIAPADVVIEFRGPDPAEINGGIAVHYQSGSELSEQRAADVARALGLRFALRARLPTAPTTMAAWAAQLERAAVLVQVSDASQADRTAEKVFGGLVNGLRAAGALEGPASGSMSAALTLVGLVIAPVAGHWQPALRVGQQLRLNDHLGTLLDDFGNELGRMQATVSGIVVSYIVAGKVNAGAALAVIGR
jgi:predicted deacylase